MADVVKLLRALGPSAAYTVGGVVFLLLAFADQIPFIGHSGRVGTIISATMSVTCFLLGLPFLTRLINLAWAQGKVYVDAFFS